MLQIGASCNPRSRFDGDVLFSLVILICAVAVNAEAVWCITEARFCPHALYGGFGCLLEGASSYRHLSSVTLSSDSSSSRSALIRSLAHSKLGLSRPNSLRPYRRSEISQWSFVPSMFPQYRANS